MKTLLGYYDKDGGYIGKKIDSIRRKKFFIVMATIRKRISEHDGESPYKNHQIIPYSKSYSDRNRMFVTYVEYDDGRKLKDIKSIQYWYGNDKDPKTRAYTRIKEHLHHNIKRMTDTAGIEHVFLPDGHDIDLRERR